MSTCLISGGIPLGCLDNSAGVYELYLANRDSISGATQLSDWTTIDSTTETITEFTGTTHAITGFYKYVPNKTSADLNETYTVDLKEGTVTFNQVINASFAKLSAEKRLQIKQLISGNFLLVLKDKNSKFWAIGLQEGVNVSNGSSMITETANGYALEISAIEGAMAHEVDGTAITVLT